MSWNIDTSAETIERVRKELAGAIIMLTAHRDSAVAKTRLKQAITDAHGNGQLTHEQTAAMFKIFDLAGA